MISILCMLLKSSLTSLIRDFVYGISCDPDNPPRFTGNVFEKCSCLNPWFITYSTSSGDESGDIFAIHHLRELLGKILMKSQGRVFARFGQLRFNSILASCGIRLFSSWNSFRFTSAIEITSDGDEALFNPYMMPGFGNPSLFTHPCLVYLRDFKTAHTLFPCGFKVKVPLTETAYLCFK